MDRELRQDRHERRTNLKFGFTVVELLTVLAIIALLAGLVLPSLDKARAKAQGLFCAKNKAEMTVAWLMYADDNADRLVPNFGEDRVHALAAANWNDNWVNNRMNWELDSGNTNRAFVGPAKLSRYGGAVVPLYRCPADHVLSIIQRKAGWSERVRSISMNGMLGDPGPSFKNGVNVNNPEYVQFLKLSAIPIAAEIFVLLDEHPDSINDGYFPDVGDSDEWVDLPASYHQGGATFSFADGHAEVHQWRYSRTKRPLNPDGAQLPFRISASQSSDFDWLMAKTSIETK